MAKRKTKAVSKNNIVTLILDETGSMSSVLDDTIGGYNTYVETLASDKPKGSVVKFTLMKFDSIKFDVVAEGVDIEKAPRLTKENYRPGASTPLYDAAMRGIRMTEKQVESTKGDKPNVTVVIQTDGQENASRETTLQALQDIIKKKTEDGWAFVFLGCNIDAYATAGSFGIQQSHTMAYDGKKSMDAFVATSAATRSFMATGLTGSASFSVEQKLKAGDKFNKP